MEPMQTYTAPFRVMECDCDSHHHLTPGAFMRLAQQVSTDHCESLGMDDAFYRANQAVFLMAKMALRLERPPVSGETLTLRTSPEQARRAVYKRITEAWDEAGRRVAVLDSRWVLVDARARRILRRPPEAFAALPFAEQVGEELDVTIRKPAALEPAGVVTASYSRCDINRHMNNTRYADVAADALPLEAVENSVITGLVISYHNELPAGGGARLVRGQNEDGSWYVAGQREDGKPCFEAVLTLQPLNL